MMHNDTFLFEDDGGGDYGGFGYGGYGGGGYGGMYLIGSTQGLYDTFVKPFIEVIQTTSGVTKEVMRRVTTVTQVALETTITTFVPIVSDSYDEIFEAEHNDIQAIREKYADIYSSNMEMFSHSDMNVLAFSIDPTRYLTAVFFKKSPKAAMKAIELITGDNENVKRWLNNIKSIYDFKSPHTVRRRSRHAESMQRLYETDTSPEEKALDTIVRMMNDKDVIHAIESSHVLDRLHTDGVNVIKRFYAAVKDDADAVDQIKNFDTLNRYVKAANDRDATNALNEFKKVATANSGDYENIVPQFVQQVKRAVKGIYGSGIDSQITAAKQAGMSNDSEIVQLFTQAKRRVEGIK